MSELEEVSLRMKINELKNQIRIYEENDNEKIISLLKENKALRCALEKYKGVKMLIEVESGFPEIKATTFVDIATETLNQLTQTGGKGG